VSHLENVSPSSLYRIIVAFGQLVAFSERMKKNKVKLLSAKERNILKYRSLQIMLYLFHVEDLKRFILGSLKATNIIHGISNEKLKLDDYLNMIVKDDVITHDEKKELISLIDFRNDISHEIHKMVNDLGDTAMYQMPTEEDGVKENYQYGALFRVKYLSQKIRNGFQSRYAMQVSFDKFIFEPAERALEHESKLLFKKMLKAELEDKYKKAT
jgi:hypothetical protein